jgi:2-oxoisovalerate dehydrogenase E1 component subunit alpha
VVFFVQNNKYAISVPLARQSVAPSLAAKAIGYGMPGARVDGNDLPALEKVLGEAVARARAGDGPTLVEADTYRIESHTNADDASRYRADDEVTEWLPRDPLLRVRTYLTAVGALDDDLEQEITTAAEEMAAAVRAGVGADTVADPEELFTHLYSTLTPQLVEQRAALRAELDLEEA